MSSFSPISNGADDQLRVLLHNGWSEISSLVGNIICYISYCQQEVFPMLEGENVPESSIRLLSLPEHPFIAIQGLKLHNMLLQQYNVWSYIRCQKVGIEWRKDENKAIKRSRLTIVSRNGQNLLRSHLSRSIPPNQTKYQKLKSSSRGWRSSSVGIQGTERCRETGELTH